MKQTTQLIKNEESKLNESQKDNIELSLGDLYGLSSNN